MEEQLYQFYDAYRDALFNKLYYSLKLSKAKFRNKATEILIALTASSAIAGWAIFSQGVGEIIWIVLSGLTTILSIIKPIINVPAEIERYSKLVSGHSDAYYDLKVIVDEIAVKKMITDDMNNAYKNVVSRLKQLAPADDLVVNQSLSREMYNEVNRIIPPESLWTL